MDIFGKSGGELVPLFSNFAGELEKARGYLGSTPQIMTRVSETFADLGDNFAAIGEKGKEFAAGLLEQIAPALVEITNRIANIDAAGLGAKLSDYAVRTGQWMSETLKLNEALKNIEIAVKGITSGNFGEGFSLMFMTARDTAFSAINQIVAAGMAALGTISDALRQLFDPGSTTMAFIAGSFNMLGAKLAAGIFDSLATVLEKIPFMGAATEAVRGAKAEAEQAATDIANIMYYEAENLKSEWAGILAEAPKAFADSYAANMKDPLIDMTERTKETAAQAEKVAAATRAAAFNAQTFAENMASARSAMLEGGDISPFGTSPGMGQNDKGFKFPWQGSGPSGPKIDVPATASGGKGAKADKPTTALDALRKAAETDVRARADVFRIEAERNRRTSRVSELMDKGFFSTAANTELRAERNAEKRAQDLLTRRSATDSLFGKDSPLKNMGELQQRFRQENPFGRREDFDRFVRDQQMTPEERKRDESERNAQGGQSQSAQASLATEASMQKLIQEIVNRLPQNALTT
jgi:hypothetical protein